MKIEQQQTGDKGAFFVQEDNEILAEMEYEMHGDILLITHTEVSDLLAGKGIGKQLVSAAVDYAREKTFIIKATCSFAKAVLNKTPEFADVYHAKNKS